jgi:hypothetical protein
MQCVRKRELLKNPRFLACIIAWTEASFAHIETLGDNQAFDA